MHIAAGWVATGYVSSDGRRFGSDNFFLGGQSGKVGGEEEEAAPESFASAGGTQAEGTPDPLLYRHHRAGKFGYAIPLENGRYELTLGFIEPQPKTKPGERVFDVLVNGKRALEGFDVLRAAEGDPRQVVTRSIPVEVSDGRLELDFLPMRGEAVVSTLSIRKR